MAERIRELEEALGVISEEHARCLHRAIPSSEPSHPLLREDLLLIKNQLELYGLDRSHLAFRSDASCPSDGSDGGEQQFLPSPSDVLFMSSASHYAEQQQHVGYAGADSNVCIPFRRSNSWPDLFGLYQELLCVATDDERICFKPSVVYSRPTDIWSE